MPVFCDFLSQAKTTMTLFSMHDHNGVLLGISVQGRQLYAYVSPDLIYIKIEFEFLIANQLVFGHIGVTWRW